MNWLYTFIDKFLNQIFRKNWAFLLKSHSNVLQNEKVIYFVKRSTTYNIMIVYLPMKSREYKETYLTPLFDAYVNKSVHLKMNCYLNASIGTAKMDLGNPFCICSLIIVISASLITVFISAKDLQHKLFCVCLCHMPQ